MSLQTPRNIRYHIVRLLGSGSMGTTYLAMDRQNPQQTVVLKRLRKASQQAKIQFFDYEARIITELSHPNILPVLDYGQETVNSSLLPYVIMPYCPDGSLASWLQQREPGDTLILEDIAHFTNQLADALQYAHDHGVIHQDVKPSNVFIHNNVYGPPDVMLADFDIAHLAPGMSGAGQPWHGTPTYMPPEQWEGHAVPASDQYALAVLVYQLLTGRSPFQGDTEQLMDRHFNSPPVPPSAINRSLSPRIDAVVLRGLAKLPENRFVTVSAFANAFEQALSPGPPLPLPGANANHRTPTSTLALVVILVFLSLGGAAFLLFSSAKNASTPAVNTAATAQAHISNTAKANSTNTAQANASSTADASANATMVAQANATPQGNVKATATAQAKADTHATATANVNATVTAQANATATVLPATQLSGHWANDDIYSQGLTRLDINNVGLTVIVQAFVACEKNECSWGFRSAHYNGSPLNIDFNLDTRNENLLISLNNADGSQLKVIDISASNGTSTYYFHKI